MNIDISNCNNLNKGEKIKLAEKLDIPDDKIKNSDNLCGLIKRYYNNKFPCNKIIKSDTDLQLKPHQISVANQLMNTRGVIVFHSVGVGKTVTSISTSQCFLLSGIIKKVIVITPTSLQENFKQQMEKYNENIDFSLYHFYTIQGISNAIKNKTVENCKNSLVIIDEAHNLRTLDGSRYENIYNYCLKAEKILLLTATPLINYKHDIINLISLARGEDPITIEEFDKMEKNNGELKNYLKDVFNMYIRTSDKYFPEKKTYEVYLEMDKNYYDMYNKVEKGEVKKIPDFKNSNNIGAFYNGVRRASNIIDEESPKVDWIIEKILDNPKSKFVIFSHYINMGIKPIITELDKKKISHMSVTGNMNIDNRKEAVDLYNSGKIKILFISKAGSEGLDLKNTTYIIILESSWNENEIEQIIGRGVRYKSHTGLSKSKQKVSVFQLYCVKPNEYENLDTITKNYLLDYKNDILSVDIYLRNYAKIKQIKIEHFYKAIRKIINY
jgi:superfamily II DNA or RNA helicase